MAPKNEEVIIDADPIYPKQSGADLRHPGL
jgi:hypothetical protein